jgi:hypothetical protein
MGGPDTIGGSGGAGGAAADGEAGEGGAGGAGGDAGEAGGSDSVALTGRVNQLLDTRFQSSARYADAAVLEAEGTAEASVSADWTGSGQFTLTGVLRQDPIWLSVRPNRDTTQVLRTLQPVHDPSETIEALLVARQTFEVGVLAQLVEPIELDDSRAQAVIFVVDSAGRGLAGVTAGLPAAAAIAYGRNGLFADEDDAGTDGSGLVVFGNVSARDYPGNDVRIEFGGVVDGFTEIRLASGAVSVATLVAD